jgi:phosphatidylglycerophosphatase A
MTPQGGWPVSSVLLVLAITWLATSLDLFSFLYRDTGFLYLDEVVGIPISLVVML